MHLDYEDIHYAVKTVFVGPPFKVDCMKQYNEQYKI